MKYTSILTANPVENSHFSLYWLFFALFSCIAGMGCGTKLCRASMMRSSWRLDGDTIAPAHHTLSLELWLQAPMSSHAP